MKLSVGPSFQCCCHITLHVTPTEGAYLLPKIQYLINTKVTGQGMLLTEQHWQNILSSRGYGEVSDLITCSVG
jgi:hypothetical protein